MKHVSEIQVDVFLSARMLSEMGGMVGCLWSLLLAHVAEQTRSGLGSDYVLRPKDAMERSGMASRSYKYSIRRLLESGVVLRRPGRSCFTMDPRMFTSAKTEWLKEKCAAYDQGLALCRERERLALERMERDAFLAGGEECEVKIAARKNRVTSIRVVRDSRRRA